MSNFTPGDLVACIEDDWCLIVGGPPAGPMPKRGTVYEVRQALTIHGYACIRLAEIPGDHWFTSACFRPVDRTRFDHLLKVDTDRPLEIA